MADAEPGSPAEGCNSGRLVGNFTWISERYGRTYLISHEFLKQRKLNFLLGEKALYGF